MSASFPDRTIHPMIARYAFVALSTCSSLLFPSSTLRAQGDTCSTALTVVTGIHLADGPATGWSGPAGCGGGTNGDWYVYTPTFTGTITISSCHPLNNNVDDDTYLKVFSGGCDALTCVDYVDDMNGASCPNYPFASFLEVAVTEGEPLFIVWTDVFDDDAFYWELNECMGTVTGVTYADNNDNAVRDDGEAQVDVMLLVEPEGSYVYAGQDPYSFCSDGGEHTITVPNPPLYHTVVPTSRSYDIYAQGVQVTGADFAFQGIPGIHDASVNLWGWNPWIGNNTQLHVSYANIGTETVEANVTLTLDPLLSFVSASIPATTVSGQVITWDLGTLSEGASGSISVTVHTSSTAAPNAPVLNSVVIGILEDDVNGENDADHLNGIATTSFDPNDKQVDYLTLTPGDVLERKPLEYTIRFQNMGTAPAVNVVVRDILDEDLDLGTFEMIGATHPYTLGIQNGEAIWTFANILLPTSDNDEAGSQGAIHYRVTPKADLIPGDEVSNRGDIYFDYNVPVLTNTVVTEVALSSGFAEAAAPRALRVDPSPSNGQVTLRWLEGQLADARLTVLDALGRSVYTSRLGRPLDASGYPLDLSALPVGTYAAWLQGNGSDTKVRFVIQR